MGNEIKDLLDGIIKDTDNNYPTDQERDTNDYVGQTFDSGKYREKLSMYVLKDIICAMMDENPKDVDSMVDDSIMKHIRDNYDGSCYGYLCGSRDRLNSPHFNVFGSIVQEIDRAVESAAECATRTKQLPVQEAAETEVSKLLENVDSYEDLKNKLTKEVSQQVVNDVTKAITDSSKAPVFDKIDDKVTVKNTEKSVLDEENDPTTESAILRMVGDIVTESASDGNRISTEDAIDHAIVFYCLAKMDQLCKQRPKKFYLGK